jgi:hypothetical protein
MDYSVECAARCCPRNISTSKRVKIKRKIDKTKMETLENENFIFGYSFRRNIKFMLERLYMKRECT